MSVIVEGAAADEVAVDDAGFVDEGAATDFEVELAFGDGGHTATFDAAGAGGNLDAVTHAGDGEVVFEEVLGHGDECGVIANVFGGAAAGVHDAGDHHRDGVLPSECGGQG